MLDQTQIAIARQILNLGGKLDGKLANMFIDEVESLQQQNRQLEERDVQRLGKIKHLEEVYDLGLTDRVSIMFKNDDLSGRVEKLEQQNRQRRDLLKWFVERTKIDGSYTHTPEYAQALQSLQDKV